MQMDGACNPLRHFSGTPQTSNLHLCAPMNEEAIPHPHFNEMHCARYVQPVQRGLFELNLPCDDLRLPLKARLDPSQ